MRTEVGRERLAASSVEGSMDPNMDQTVAERLRGVVEERQGWISKRQKLLARKLKLEKLLKLQNANLPNEELITPHTATNKMETGLTNDPNLGNKDAKAAAVALDRKIKIKELQTRAVAAKEKQQHAATVLIRNLKQLSARQGAQLNRTLRSPDLKRKRQEDEAEEMPNKKADVKAFDEVIMASMTALEMHPFAAASDLDVGTAELVKATCFRIASRYYLVTGTTIPRDVLEQSFEEYTGNTLEEAVDASALERFVEYINVDGTKFATDRSSAETRDRRVWWQPGRQFLRAPTFISSNAVQIQTLIDVEKQIVVDACETLILSGSQQSRSTALKNVRRQNQFLASLLSEGNAAPNSFTLSTILSACIGVDSNESTTNLDRKIPYRSRGQMAAVFVDLESWLCEQAGAIEPQNSASSRFYGISGHQKDNKSFTGYSTPFCVENDSVVKQLRGFSALQASGTKKIDPFKVLCQYELNGVCNDKNCSSYHQKDYAPVVNKPMSPDVNANDTTRKQNPQEKNHLLLLFAELRGRTLTKWPVITTTTTSSAAAEIDVQMNSAAEDATSADLRSIVAENMQEDDGDFIMLDPPVESPRFGDVRYFDDVESRKRYGDSLQTRVDEDPNDTDAWILLSIYHLELDVGLSDDAVNLSDDVRMQKQLLFLCEELSGRHSSNSCRDLNIGAENLKRCLHTLSRSLEVEANAYCEALWLLYLHLCRQTGNKQTEIDMAEHAVQFLPSSHALWLRYISTYDFDSVSMAEGIYCRLMDHLARVDSTEDGVDAAKATPSKELSILLSAMCFHLCIKLWRAGATSRVLELLSALLQLGEASSEFDWCDVVRCRLRSDETIIFCLVFAHVSLFNELPALMEHWVEVSSCESIPITGMAYTVESIPRHLFQAENNFAQVLASYERAFTIYEEKCSGIPDVGGVILNNWMLVLSLRFDENTREESLKVFFTEKLSTIQQYPTAALTAAKIIGLTSGKQQALELMTAMMNQSSDRNFPKALHHYLFVCLQSGALVADLDKTFPDVMKRLASYMESDVDAVEKSIQDILQCTSNLSKSCALNDLLDRLLADWMSHLDLQRHETQQRQSSDSQSTAPVDIYVALAICQLMGILLKMSVAIDGLQMILNSPRFGVLSLEARQLAWMQRFVFQIYWLEQNDSEDLSWKECQAKLIQLFRKYMSEMSVKAEIVRQVSKRIKHDFERKALEDAICDCLYPERSCLITYDVSLELFRLCFAAVAGPEKAAFCASFTSVLALAPEFSLTFADTAAYEWELLAARASLRKCLGGTKTQHPQVLQALVALELRLRNMKSVSSLLQNELRADPLVLDTWRLVVGLEVLFGEKVAERSEKIAAEMEKRQLVFNCNTFGDDVVNEEVESLLSNVSEASTTLSLRGFGLEFVPNAVLLKSQLVSLDLSGNTLMELPDGLNRLKNLQKLTVSENSLVNFPLCVNDMDNLEELSLAHNNLSVMPALHLPNVRSMDLSWNALEHLDVSDFAALKNIKTLHTEGNAIPADEMSKISELLSSRKKTVPCDVKALSTQNPCQQKSEEQLSRTSSAGNDGVNSSTVAISANDMSSSAADASSVTAEDGSITSRTVGDGVDRGVNTETNTLMTKSDGEDQIIDVEEVISTAQTSQAEDVEEPIMSSTHVSKENHIDVDAEEVNLTSVATQETLGEVSNEVCIDVDNEEANIKSVSKTNNRENVVDIEAPATLMPTEDNQQLKEVIDVDSDEAESDKEEQGPTTSNNADVTVDTTNEEKATMTVTNDTASMAAAKDFTQNYSQTVTVAGKQRVGSKAAHFVMSKLTAYMEQNGIHNRAEVRTRNPELWQELVAANISEAAGSPPCRLCFAPCDGNNQRLNSTALCLHCLEHALIVLKKRRDDLEH